MRTVRDIPALQNIPVLVRAALNVPVENGKVVNTFRLRKALPTIDYLRKQGARVVLIGHIGEAGTETLQPVYEAMKTMVPNMQFCPVTIGEQARAAVRALHPGDVLMLENLRRNVGETKNDKAFAQELADLGDVFVQDSFDVCHRVHASVVSVPEFLPSYAGLQVEEEVRELSKALKPQHPALAIIGGAKFATKEPVLVRLLAEYDRVFVSGALGNDFIKAQGYNVGMSLVSDADPKEIKSLLANRRLTTPIDVTVGTVNGTKADSTECTLDAIPADKAILDNGPKTVQMIAGLIKDAKFIIWNGPLGKYESGYTDSTFALARAIAQSGAHSIVGGGDTVAAVEELGAAARFSFISTGGGAMLDFLAKGSLPGLDALQK